MQLLLERGEDLEAQTDVHNIALHLATEAGKVAVAQLLIDHGASI